MSSTPPEGQQPDPHGQPPAGPYGQPQPDPYGQPPAGPYGQPPAGPYGAPPSSGPYGAPPSGGYPPGGRPPAPGGVVPVLPTDDRPTDVVSVLGLVLAFLLAPVGLVLSIIGLVRTSGGRRKGRGLAIAGVVVSIVVTILAGLAIAALVLFGRAVADNVDLDDFVEEEGEAAGEAGEAPDPGTALALGERASVGDFEVTVTGVDLDAGDALEAGGNPPPDGRYVLVTADVTNTTAQAQSVYFGLNVSYLSASGTAFDEFTCDATFDGAAALLPDLEAQQTTQVGWCLDVPAEELQDEGVVVVAPTTDTTGDAAVAWRDR